LRCAISADSHRTPIRVARSEVMPGEDLELRVSALERRIDEERKKTDSALEHLQQQIRQMKRELQTMNVRLANTAQRR
jgi:hypothetical protein